MCKIGIPTERYRLCKVFNFASTHCLRSAKAVPKSCISFKALPLLIQSAPSSDERRDAMLRVFAENLLSKRPVGEPPRAIIFPPRCRVG